MWSFKALDKSMKEISVLKTTAAVKNTFRSLERAGGGGANKNHPRILGFKFLLLERLSKALVQLYMFFVL